MKTCYSCIFCIFYIIGIFRVAPAQVRDDFSDGNFTYNPTWAGDTANFEINIYRQLHLRSTGSDTSVLATRITRANNMEWNFWMKLSFNTSSNNHARIYLAADTSALFSATNSYFIQVGGGDDSIYIMKQTDISVKKMFSLKSYKADHSTNTLRFRIICDEYGKWEAMVDTTGGYNYYSDGTFIDSTFHPSRWFGVFCRYTSSNSTKFYFDDFYVGPIIRDTLPPTVISQDVNTERTIRVTFSEAIQKEAAETATNFQVLSNGAWADSVIFNTDKPDEVGLIFHEPVMVAKLDSLSIRNITDISGNRMSDTIVPICYYLPKAYDILIHEIMADPDPPVELPNSEFVELYNRTQFPINLKDWSLKYGSFSKIFPSLTIRPNDYLLIVKDSNYMNWADCAVLFTSASSLSNEGTTLVIKDPQRQVIHSVSFSPDWFRGSFKEEGGWSLEMIDPSNPCGCSENWAASKDASGGTPGRANSVYKSNPDDEAPIAARAIISDSSLLEVYFTEAMDSASLLSAEDWLTGPFENNQNGMTNPARVEPISPDFKTTKLFFNEVFKSGITYFLRLSGNQKDCAGNFSDSSGTIRFAIPDTVSCRDIIINEILSDPLSGGSRFVELYNRSEKIIDLRSLVLSNSDTLAGLLPNATPLISNGYLLFPGNYIVITPSPDDICEKYRSPAPEAIIGMTGFPVFGDDTGTVILARKDNLIIIDKVQYGSEMHYPLLTTREGVSLERTNPEMSSDDKNNWHSAAETVGFATPAYQNSHWVRPGETDDEINIEPDIFSPDNDGRDDLLNIIIRENNPDCGVNITIYDSRGRLIKQLANNVLSGNEGFFVWDGMTDNRGKAPLGFYILLIEFTRPDGTVRIIKRTTVLAGKL